MHMKNSSIDPDHYSAVVKAFKYIVFSFPILLLTAKGGMSASFFLMVALSAFVLYQAGWGAVKIEFDRDAKLFSFAMGATFLSILMSQTSNGEWGARHFDSASRLLLAIPVFLVLRNIEPKVIGVLQYGLPLGALVIGASVWMSGQQMIAQTYFLIHIHLGDLALMLGFLSVCSINWTQKDSAQLVALKLLGLLAGLYVSLVSGARGGWAAIPVFLLLWVAFTATSAKALAIRLVLLMVVMLGGMLMLYSVVDVVQIRLDAAIHDLSTTSKDTSLGIRFQLWGAAIQLFLDNPIFGTGVNGFRLAMDNMADAGMITREAAENGRGEVHSYYFAVLARQGIVGVLSIILLFGIPFIQFVNAMKSPDAYRRGAGRMGLALVSGFAVYCLTVEMFNLKMVATFYAATIAVLLAAVGNRRANQSTTINQQQGITRYIGQ
ncbi:MAG: O-antigen ligase family protein [Pseudomonadota bacterium]